MLVKAAFVTGSAEELVVPARRSYTAPRSPRLRRRRRRADHAAPHPPREGQPGRHLQRPVGLSEGERVAVDPIAAGVQLKDAAKASAMAKLGFSGGVAARFLTTQITPLLALLGLLLGLFAVLVTPRERSRRST